MKPILCLGAMTGNSCDQIDFTLVEWGKDWKVLNQMSAPYPANLRERVLKIQGGAGFSLEEFAHLDRDLGDWYADVFAGKAKGLAQKADVICNHGQAVFHQSNSDGKGHTIQIGDPTRIAGATQKTIVADVRRNDIASGGEGAPLAPLAHLLIAKKLGLEADGISFHNLGGISNLTYFKDGKPSIAFDTGPGNLLIDGAIQKASSGKILFDQNGKMASSAAPDDDVCEKFLAHPYFARKPPKSTGRNEFRFSDLEKLTSSADAGLVSTATEITARSIINDYKNYFLKASEPLTQIVFCGGGAKNTELLDRIQKGLPDQQVSTLDELGFDSQQVESFLFSLIGIRSLLGLSVGGAWTGSKKNSAGGTIIPGSNWDSLQPKIDEWTKSPPSYLST